MPERVRAQSVDPCGENQTCATGPVAGDASINSAEDGPTLRQSGWDWACANPPASASAKRATGKRTVAH
jgi:hypothetical protein